MPLDRRPSLLRRKLEVLEPSFDDVVRLPHPWPQLDEGTVVDALAARAMRPQSRVEPGSKIIQAQEFG